MSEISNVCNAVEGHCIQAMKIGRHHANDRFDWLISGHQNVNPSREAISIIQKFTLLHSVCDQLTFYEIDYVHIVPDRFLLHFKSCFDTV